MHPIEPVQQLIVKRSCCSTILKCVKNRVRLTAVETYIVVFNSIESKFYSILVENSRPVNEDVFIIKENHLLFIFRVIETFKV